MLEQANNAEDIEAKEVIYKLLNKRFDSCTDSDIGRCIERIEMLFEQARQPAPVGKPTNYTPVFEPGIQEEEPQDSSPAIMRERLQNILHSYRLPKEQIIQVLKQLLKDYKD